MRLDKAIWLAMAQPSSARKLRKALTVIRTDSVTKRNGRSRRPGAFQIIHRRALCKGTAVTLRQQREA
jgi:hypothetical protein